MRVVISLCFIASIASPMLAEDVDYQVSDNVRLGWLLFYDPILSGNKNISCSTCHHPKFGTSDGVSLSIGEGGIGLGPARVVDPENPPEQRIPRNAPVLFNLDAAEFVTMFADGRLEFDPNKPNNIRTPLGDDMTEGFDSILSAQAMFPVLSGDEMAGHYSENEISELVRIGQLSHTGGAWEAIAARVENIAEYRQAFDAVIGTGEPIGFTDISNVLADFIAFEWQADNSLYDQFLRGEANLSPSAMSGYELFYGDAGCGACHSGRFQTDHAFHAIAIPQFGPGKAARFESHAQDVGRLRVTGDIADAYRFRTPTLRNISASAPYGHTGAYATLEGIIRHHLDPVNALYNYDRAQAILPELDVANDWAVFDDPEEMAAIAAANELVPQSLTDQQISDLIAFLESLTDEQSLAGRLGIPDVVPSGLPID